MSALHQVLQELAINVLPAQQRASLITDLARQHGLDDAMTTALLSGDSAQLIKLSNTASTCCMAIVAPDAPVSPAGCLIIVAPDLPVH